MTFVDIHLGRPLSRGALTLYPIFNGEAVTEPDYDLAGTDLVVAERPDGPLVDELVVTNLGSRPAVVLEGEELHGGWQDRIAARTILIGPGHTEPLACRCTEEGRWHGSDRHTRSGSRAPLRVRTRSREGQGAVWAEVTRYERQYGGGQTAALRDATRAAGQQANDLVRGLQPLALQTGVLIGIAGQPLLAEVVDAPSTLAHTWRALLRAAAVDAIGMPPVPTPGRRARRFVERLTHLQLLGERQAGLGRELHAASDSARLHSLRWRGRAVHTVAINTGHELVAA
jgi:hypothetical protein